MKTSDIFVENFINKKLLLAAFYHLTYQHDSKDFNICNYISSLLFLLQWFLGNYSYQIALSISHSGVVNVVSSTSGRLWPLSFYLAIS